MPRTPHHLIRAQAAAASAHTRLVFVAGWVLAAILALGAAAQF